MNFNATLIGQMITFGLLVLFTMKYVWQPIMQAMQDRQKRIADGARSTKRRTPPCWMTWSRSSNHTDHANG